MGRFHIFASRAHSTWICLVRIAFKFKQSDSCVTTSCDFARRNRVCSDVHKYMLRPIWPQMTVTAFETHDILGSPCGPTPEVHRQYNLKNFAVVWVWREVWQSVSSSNYKSCLFWRLCRVQKCSCSRRDRVLYFVQKTRRKIPLLSYQAVSTSLLSAHMKQLTTGITSAESEVT